MSVGPGIWQLDAPEYQDCYLQLPATFAGLQVSGQAIAMNLNRGVLLATGEGEPGAIIAMLRMARSSFTEKPWSLGIELFRITSQGPELFQPDGKTARLLSNIQQLDLAGTYDAQKSALEGRFKELGSDLFVATY